MVTIKDVAKRAQVSPSTVSRTLKDSSAISQATKAKVRKAMQELGYVPNLAAQVLATGLTQSLGVVFPPLKSQGSISQPFYMEMITAINAESSQHAQVVTVATGTSLEELAQQVKLMHKQKRADGFILLYSDETDPVRRYLQGEGIPFVVVGSPISSDDRITYIDNDNVQLGQEAVTSLYRKGYERIAFVTDNPLSMVSQKRFEGYQMACERLGLSSMMPIIYDDRHLFDAQNLHARLKQVGVTALVVIDDLVALRVMQDLKAQEARFPDDYALISFNNTAFSAIVHPYLTSFDIGIKQLGQESVRALLSILQDKKEEPKQIIVPFSLVERESTPEKGQ